MDVYEDVYVRARLCVLKDFVVKQSTEKKAACIVTTNLLYDY